MNEKKFTKIAWRLFRVGHIFLSMMSALYITSDSPLEKMKFFFANGYQFQKASWLEVGTHVSLSALLLLSAES